MASWKTSTAILALFFLLMFTFPETEGKRVVRVLNLPKRVDDDDDLSLYKIRRVFKPIEEIVVGGHENSWTNPASVDYLDQWSNKTDFAVGDSLIFKYDGKSDSVLQVSKENYEACNTAHPIKEYKDGNTKIELDRDAMFYFISGAEGHCVKGQKVRVSALFDFVHYVAWRDEITRKFMSLH